MKQRREFDVSVACHTVPPHVSIVWDGAGFVLVDELTEVPLAFCGSAKRLADWAFESGAEEVRHEYDLKLSDGEL